MMSKLDQRPPQREQQRVVIPTKLTIGETCGKYGGALRTGTQSGG
jgi:hypothetical protein